MTQASLTPPGLAFHCHHDILVEYVYDYNERVDFIKKAKPEEEQELRLRLFKLIPSNLIPGKDSTEWKAYDKTSKAYCVTDKAYRGPPESRYRAGIDYHEAKHIYEHKYHKQLEELHFSLCPDCPWNGKTIFSNQKQESIRKKVIR